MGALDDLATEVNSLLTGFGLTQSKSAWLTGNVAPDDVSWALDSTSSMGEGVAEIGDELVYVRRYTDGTLLIAPDGRGYDGTAPTAHATGDRIRMEPTFPITAVKRAVNTTIGRTFPIIWAVETVDIPFEVSRGTYELPAETEKILRVRYDIYGPSGDWPDTEYYSYDGHADPTKYPSGKTITLDKALTPGRNFRVTVSKRPTVLDPADSDFSATGLSPSARYAVILGSVAYLTAFLDPVRLQTYSASSSEMATTKPVITASKLSADFEQKFQSELQSEATRLRQTYPTRIHRRR